LTENPRPVIKNVCPCDDCEHVENCRVNELACRPFSNFVSDNYFYPDALRDPCRGIFNKIFEQDDAQLLLELIVKLKEENEDPFKGDKGK